MRTSCADPSSVDETPPEDGPARAPRGVDETLPARPRAAARRDARRVVFPRRAATVGPPALKTRADARGVAARREQHGADRLVGHRVRRHAPDVGDGGVRHGCLLRFLSVLGCPKKNALVCAVAGPLAAPARRALARARANGGARAASVRKGDFCARALQPVGRPRRLTSPTSSRSARCRSAQTSARRLHYLVPGARRGALLTTWLESAGALLWHGPRQQGRPRAGDAARRKGASRETATGDNSATIGRPPQVNLKKLRRTERRPPGQARPGPRAARR